MNAIEVRGLSKRFDIYPSVGKRLIEYATCGKVKSHSEFLALHDINFEVPKGSTFGIIGQNGSGKSTLLSILAGVLQPTSGTFFVDGRVSALLELGAGFHQEFSGKDNVYMYGTIMGLSKKDIDSRFDEIVDFSELHEFINRPLYTYSSGMVVRLAFSVAVNVDADILIIDEALAVGDMFFQAKCMLKIKELIRKGATLIFVSHDIVSVKSICDKSLLLDSGKVIDYGASDRVIEKYFSMKVEKEQSIIEDIRDMAVKYDNHSDIWNDDEFQKRASFQRIQNGQARFANIQLLDEHGDKIFIVGYEQEVILRMAIEVFRDISVLGFGYHIRDKNGIDVVYSDSLCENQNLYSLKTGERYIVDWRFSASLKDGDYTIACPLSVGSNGAVGCVSFCDFIPLAVRFTISSRGNAPLYGSVHWKNNIKIILAQ
jgi:lipopolysaccharide transport system ATP-binding protein